MSRPNRVWLLLPLLSSVALGQSFINWENLGVHSLDITPDGSRLLVASTADNRLEVFDLTSGSPVALGAVPVGLDPVAVRARTNSEVWVVNHISDSISIVDLTTMNVVATLSTADEPADVVFAGSSRWAFVSCSQANRVQVFDPADLSAPPIEIPIAGEDPRALAVSPDGNDVYLAVFESGNATTILGGGLQNGGALAFPPNVVNLAAGPWGGLNPPPNDGPNFNPPQRPGNPPPPRVGLIVRKNENGEWFDDNGGDWTELVTGARAADSGRAIGWDMPDRDLAVIDANALTVDYAKGLMTTCMAVGVNPADGVITVVGTEAINQIRYEPNVNSVFVRVHMASVNPDDLSDKTIVDLNPHLDYNLRSLPQPQRDRAVGDPRAIVWNAAGDKGYVAGLGSNNVIVIDPGGARAGLAETIEVGQGPIALALDEPRSQLYVFNRFDGSLSVIDTNSQLETARIPLFDPTPTALATGRRHFYSTHDTSGLGQLACASCHVDARTDRLAWDLGDPAGIVQPLGDANLGAGILGLSPPIVNPPFSDFHPMKGPMTTQTLQNIIGHEPHHWRGDRPGLEDFNPAFVGLLGDDQQLSAMQMQEFEDFLATIHLPPNPFREFDNGLPTELPLPGHFTTGRFEPAGRPLPDGDAINGLELYTSTSRTLDGPFACVTCHTLPTGAGTDFTWSGGMWQQLAPGPNGERHHALVSVDGSTQHAIKIPQIRTLYEKVGFNALLLENTAGFGVLHDGSVDSIERFISEPAFSIVSAQEVADLTAFMLAFSGSDLPRAPNNNPLFPPGTPSQDTHAAVGTQLTFNGANNNDPAAIALFDAMLDLVADNDVRLIAKGIQDGLNRGWAHRRPSGLFQSDRLSELLTPTELRLTAAFGEEITITVVPRGTATRIGVDRDLDGFFDRDEIDACSDPADPTSTPDTVDQRGDLNCDCTVNALDIEPFLVALFDPAQYPIQYPNCDINNGDINGDGSIDALDIEGFIGLLFP